MKRTPTPLTVSAGEAAQRLAAGLGGRVENWTIWLKNDRRPGKAHRIPPEPGPGRPRYALAALDAYINALSGTKPQVAAQAREAGEGEAGLLLQGAVMLDDNQLRDELEHAHMQGEPLDLVAFELLTGLDQNSQPTIWVRSGLKGGLNVAITMPFTLQEVEAKRGGFDS